MTRDSLATGTLALLAALALSAAPSIVAAAAAPPATAPEPAPDRFLTDLERLGQYFDAHPELKTQPSTGWKPYNRAKWFRDARMENGRSVDPHARWSAWEVKKAREGRQLGRSAWFEIGPTNLSGRVLAIAFDPTNASTVYVGAASGGLWKTTDGGDTWVPKTDELPSIAIGGVAVSATDPQIVVIGTGEGTPNADAVSGIGILRSTDGGSTWNPTNVTYTVNSGTGFHFIEVNPGTGTMLAGERSGLWRSTDDGATWAKVRASGDYWDAEWKTGTTRVYTIGGGSAFGTNTMQVSTNDGATWANSASGLPAASGIGKSKISVCRDTPTTVFVHLSSASTYGTLGLYRSTNDGATWAARNTSLNAASGQGWYNLTVAVDPNNPDRVVMGGVENWGSSNGGTSFVEVGDGYGLGTNTALHFDHHVLEYEPGSNSNLWVGTDGGVWRSTDDGATWISRREGIGTYQFYDISVAQSDPAAILGGAQDNGVPGRVTVDSWFTSNLFADGFVCNVSPTNANLVYSEWQFGNHVKSTDGGGSWANIQSGLGSNSGEWLSPTDLDPANSNRLFTETGSGIYRTTSGGSSWAQVSTHSAIWISISPVDGNVVWTVEGTPRRTTNGGTSWTTASGYGFSTGGSATKILGHPTDANAAFVTFGGYGSGAHIALTTDLGASWSNVTGDFPAQPVNAIAVDPQFPADWYIGTDVAVWQSTDGGATWLPFASGLPNAVVSDLEIRDSERKLVAGTYGRGAWEVNIAGGAVGVAELSAEPRNLMLDPPFPNPAKGSVSLRFAARHEGNVELAVYDVAGRLVRDLGVVARGDGVIRSTTWNTEGVTPGAYFAVLRAGDAKLTRKIVVTK